MAQDALAQSALWQELILHRQALRPRTLQDLILSDPNRLDSFEISCQGLRYNFALNFITANTIELLGRLAKQQKLAEMRSRMFSGERINVTENRAALHTALRQKTDVPVIVDGQDIIPHIRATRHRMVQFANDVREGRWLGATNKPIRHVVNIGIGGSDLGPRLACRALSQTAHGPEVHFVANADAFELMSLTKNLDPAETLFVIVSKTFTTQETLLNARAARSWLVGKLGEKAVAKHFVAVSVNLKEVEAFGIAAINAFPMWDWVGGRYSLWSAVGLSIMLSIGAEEFGCMLSGAAAMDEHFLTAAFAENMPLMMALIGIWNRDFLDMPALAVLPYSERLRDLPRYLQQLDMESNGKSVTRDGSLVNYMTTPVLFGECGTVGQHSFHQWLHQGTTLVPADFIGVTNDDLGQAEQHHALLSNLTAQAGTLALGRAKADAPQDVYAGGRPSNVLMLDRLDPYNFGMLLALYEHKVFCQGVIWNINSFDQPGVELGKRLARALAGHNQPSDDSEKLIFKLFQKLSPKTK